MDDEQIKDMSPRDLEMMGIRPESLQPETEKSESESEAPKSKIEKSEHRERLFESQDISRFENMAESAKRISRRLKEKEQSRFNPVIDQSEISRFSVIASVLQELSQTTDPKQLEDIRNALSRLNHSFEAFGKVPKANSIRDDAESLKRLSSSIREFGQISLELIRSLGGKEKPEYKDIIQTLHRGADASEKVYLALRKKARALENIYK